MKKKFKKYKKNKILKNKNNNSTSRHGSKDGIMPTDTGPILVIVCLCVTQLVKVVLAGRSYYCYC